MLFETCNPSHHARLEEIALTHGPAARGRDEEDGGRGHAAGEHGVEHAGLEALGVGLDDDGRRDALDGGGAGERDGGVPAGGRARRVGSAGALKIAVRGDVCAERCRKGNLR